MNNVFNIFLKKKKRDLILLSVEKMVTKNFFKAFLRAQGLSLMDARFTQQGGKWKLSNKVKSESLPTRLFGKSKEARVNKHGRRTERKHLHSLTKKRSIIHLCIQGDWWHSLSIYRHIRHNYAIRIKLKIRTIFKHLCSEHLFQDQRFILSNQLLLSNQKARFFSSTYTIITLWKFLFARFPQKVVFL